MKQTGFLFQKFLRQEIESNYARRMNELLSWQFAVGVILALVTIGVAVLALGTPDDFRVTKGCFLLAAMFAMGRIILWGAMTNRDPMLRFVVCFVSFGIIGTLAVGAIRYVNRKHDAKVNSAMLVQLANEANARAQKLASIISDATGKMEEALKQEVPKLDEDELASNQADAERIIVEVTPEYLTNFFNEHTAAQANRLLSPYVGKWIEVSGFVVDVYEESDYSSVFLDTDPRPESYRYYVIAYFRNKKWIDRASVLKRDDCVSVLGKIYRASSTSLHLEDCEIIDTY